MKQRIYTDTSVLGGCFDKEFKKHSIELIDDFRKGSKILSISDLTLKEIGFAPKNIQDILNSIPESHKEYLELDEEAMFLAMKYIEEEAISEKYIVDSQHIAIATVNRSDVLVSWNFQHIVNLRRIHLYNSTNLKYGYPIIEIRSPREVINDE